MIFWATLQNKRAFQKRSKSLAQVKIWAKRYKFEEKPLLAKSQGKKGEAFKETKKPNTLDGGRTLAES